MIAMHRSISLPASALLLALICLPAHALKSDRDKPMDVQTGNADVQLNPDGTATLTGGVVITQGSLEIHADKAVVTRKKDAVSHVTLTGTPATLSQQKDEGGRTTAHAQRIEYDVSADNIELFGNVQIDEASGSLTGEHLVYDLSSGRINAEGQNDGRVHLRLLPTNKTDEAKP